MSTLHTAPASIAPHLLHSPVQPHQVNLHHFMLDSYRSGTSESPNSPCYASPSSSANNNTMRDNHTLAAESVTSPRGMLVIYSYGPAYAPPGTALTAQVDFTNISGANVRLRIVFGDLALPTSVFPNVSIQQREPGQERGNWKLKIIIPPVGQASQHTAEVRDGQLQWPLTLQALDASGNLLDTISFGLFTYENMSSSRTGPPSPSYEYRPRSTSPNKRFREDDEDYSPSTPIKRLAIDTDELHLRRLSSASAEDAYALSLQAPTAHRTFPDAPPLTQALNIHSSFSPPQYPRNPQLHQSATQQQQVESYSQRLPELFAVPSSPGAHSDDSPALIRTSQLGNDTKPEQASVAIRGDLDTMKRAWLETEYAAGRRLVQFWKRQLGTTLHISFSAIQQSEYKENTIVVSCIYRDNVDDYFITSVDVIYLLEALAGNRFEVEEKNRIRRNLEGFKPVTISKSKPGTEEFFRVIMELPPPRPRNIEKDVKVFEWSKIKMMLEKVFSKYSTVPLPKIPLPPSCDKPLHGSLDALYASPRTSRGNLDQLPQLPIAPVIPQPISQKRRSSIPMARLHDGPTLPPLHTTFHNQSAHPTYPDHFLAARFGEYDEGPAPGDYAYGSGIRLFDLPLEIQDQTLLKVETSSAGGHLGRHHDRFRTGSPVSCDNSPLSMSLSISSGTSSDGGHMENNDLTSMPMVAGGN